MSSLRVTLPPGRRWIMCHKWTGVLAHDGCIFQLTHTVPAEYMCNNTAGRMCFTVQGALSSRTGASLKRIETLVDHI